MFQNLSQSFWYMKNNFHRNSNPSSEHWKTKIFIHLLYCINVFFLMFCLNKWLIFTSISLPRIHKNKNKHMCHYKFFYYSPCAFCFKHITLNLVSMTTTTSFFLSFFPNLLLEIVWTAKVYFRIVNSPRIHVVNRFFSSIS